MNIEMLGRSGMYTCEQSEWDADSEKLATGIEDGITLCIYNKTGYTDGCNYAFSKNGHWYLY